MPLYYFNVHDDGPPQWDDVGQEYIWRRPIEDHARSLIVAAQVRQKERGKIGITTTVIVHYDDGDITLIVTGRLGRDPSLVWSERT